MSDLEVKSVEVDSNVRAQEGSLSERMSRRASELEAQVTEKFGVPTWEDIVEVELRLIGWEALRKIVTRYERMSRNPAMQELYMASDQLLLGTERFYEVHEDGTRTPNDHTWVSLAQATGKPLPADVSPRQAMISLCGDTNVLLLWREWQDWMSTRRSEVGEEVGSDFAKTQ